MKRPLTGLGRPAHDEPSSPEAILMEHRVDMFCRKFAAAERDCGIKFADGDSIPDCADQIVKAAKGARLNPEIYSLAWTIRKWANERSESAGDVKRK